MFLLRYKRGPAADLLAELRLESGSNGWFQDAHAFAGGCRQAVVALAQRTRI